MIRIGLVGCGRMGEVHLRLIKGLAGVEVVGVADPDLHRAKALAAMGTIGLVAQDLEGLLELARLDAVHILTPPPTHASLACAALRAGCHVFVEKPMALTAREARMIAAAIGGNQVLAVGHNHLFDPVIRQAHARVTEGVLGQLIGLDAFHGTLAGWPAWVADLSSGPWINDVSHPLYLSRLFMGNHLAIRVIGHPPDERSKVTELRIIAQHAGGVSSLTFSAGTVPYRHRLTLFGTKRTLEVDLIAGTLVETRPFSGHRWLNKGLATLDMSSQLLLCAGKNAVRVLMGLERGWPGLRALIEAFYAAVRQGGPSPVPVTDGVRVAELLEEIERLLKVPRDGRIIEDEAPGYQPLPRPADIRSSGPKAWSAPMKELPTRSVPPKVAILILNWNGKRDTLETLESVRGLKYERFEVFLVDNGSTDGSFSAIAREFPEVHVLSSPENLGVAGGRNFGLEAILHRPDVEYVLILDNDVTVEAHLLDKLVASAETHADLGIVGPIIYYHSDPDRIRSAGVSIVFREVTAKSRAKDRLETGDRAPGINRVHCINGCCMLVKRKVFQLVGGFNPQYFMVNNETEFCYRAGKLGFASAVVTHAKLWHKVSASTGGGYVPGRAYYTGRSTILFLKEHGRPWHWVTTLTCAALSLPIAYFRERSRGNQRAVTMKLRGYMDGLLGRPVHPEVQRYFQRDEAVLAREQRVQQRS